jgi:signal recognition particle subunit SRP72
VVAQNNEVAAGVGDTNSYLTQRFYQSTPELSGNDKLFKFQESALKRNQYAVDLQIQKFPGVASSTANLIRSATTPAAAIEVAGLGVVNAAAQARLQTGKTALSEILPMLEKRPNDIGLLLTIIQLYVQTKNPGSALTLLETFLRRLEAATTPDYGDVRFAPGLVAVAVALYRLQGRQNAIRSELAKASAYWRSKSRDSTTSLLREAGVQLLKSSNPEDVASAGATFESIVAKSTEDTMAVAGLIASFATKDYAKIEPYVKNLTPIERLVAGIDVVALVDAGVASAPASVQVASGKKRAAEAPAGKIATKRRRKIRLPKNYEEGKQPDPERWLPLRDRSTYKPKGRKGKKRAQESTQGGVVKEEETLELVGGAGAVKVEKAMGGKKKKKGKK